MSILRNHGLVSFECDTCGDVLDTEQDDFSEALGAMKDEDWRAFKNHREEWEHKCPDCFMGLRK